MGFSNADPIQLASVLTRLIGDGSLRARLGRQARLSAETRFSRRRVAAKFAEHLCQARQGHREAENGSMDKVERAARTGGTSSEAIYAMVSRTLASRGATGRVYDIGCGTGALHGWLDQGRFDYLGVDLVRYENYPAGVPFQQLSLDQPDWNLEPESADVVVSVETIEHIENPRHHVRQMTRLTRPGGIVLVTTPNNLSWLSMVTLARKGVFNSFQEGRGMYPSHITALVETDLCRIFTECGLVETETAFTNQGRVPFTRHPWPRWLKGRRFSDNMLAVGQKPPSTQNV